MVWMVIQMGQTVLSLNNPYIRYNPIIIVKIPITKGSVDGTHPNAALKRV